jgi:hypothetical protein
MHSQYGSLIFCIIRHKFKLYYQKEDISTTIVMIWYEEYLVDWQWVQWTKIVPWKFSASLIMLCLILSPCKDIRTYSMYRPYEHPVPMELVTFHDYGHISRFSIHRVKLEVSLVLILQRSPYVLKHCIINIAPKASAESS